MAGSDVSLKDQTDIVSAMDVGMGTMIFDNEPRNKEIISRMEKVIEKGWKLCFWPDSIACKDINDMILSNISKSKIIEIINNNTYQSLNAKTHLAIWRKK